MRKIVSFLIAAVMSAGIFTHAPAAASPQALRSLHPAFSEQIFDISLDGSSVTPGSLTDISIYPDSVLEIVLAGEGENADLFFDQNGLAINTADVTASRLRAARASVLVETQHEGVLVVESAELKVRNAGGPFSRPVIVISFARSFSDLDPMPFSFDIFITMAGIKQPQSAITVSGIFGNRELAVTYEDAAIAPDGAVFLAYTDIASIEVDAGYGIFVTASLRAGGRYRVVSSPSTETGDLEALSLNPRLIEIILIDYIGFSDGDISEVSIDTEENLFVYDENGGFIGMTSDSLPPLSKYLLTTRRIGL